MRRYKKEGRSQIKWLSYWTIGLIESVSKILHRTSEIQSLNANTSEGPLRKGLTLKWNTQMKYVRSSDLALLRLMQMDLFERWVALDLQGKKSRLVWGTLEWSHVNVRMIIIKWLFAEWHSVISSIHLLFADQVPGGPKLNVLNVNRSELVDEQLRDLRQFRYLVECEENDLVSGP